MQPRVNAIMIKFCFFKEMTFKQADKRRTHLKKHSSKGDNLLVLS